MPVQPVLRGRAEPACEPDASVAQVHRPQPGLEIQQRRTDQLDMVPHAEHVVEEGVGIESFVVVLLAGVDRSRCHAPPAPAWLQDDAVELDGHFNGC